MLSHRAQQTIFDIGMIAACIGIVALAVVIGIHEHLEKRWKRITKGKKHFTQRELREYAVSPKAKERNRDEKTVKLGIRGRKTGKAVYAKKIGGTST